MTWHRHCNTLQHTATHRIMRFARCLSLLDCKSLQQTAVQCNILQHIATHRITQLALFFFFVCVYAIFCVCFGLHLIYVCKWQDLFLCHTLQHTGTHCTTLHHTATHCTTPQHTAITSEFWRVSVTIWRAFPPSLASHCNTLHHTAPHRTTLQHVAPYCHHFRILESERYNVKGLFTKFLAPHYNTWCITTCDVQIFYMGSILRITLL